MNKIIFSILLLILSISIDANNQSITPKDKLYAVIDSCNRSEVELTDVRKKQIILLARNIKEDKAAIDFFMKNELYGSAYHSKMQKSLSDNKLDSVYHYYKESIINYDKYEKEDSKLLVPSMQCNLVYWAVNNGYYEIAIKTVNDMKQFVLKNGLTEDLLLTYQLLSMVYQMMDIPAESIEVAKEGLALNIDQPKTAFLFLSKSALYQQLIQSCTAIKKYEESLFYCNLLKQWIEQKPTYKSSNMGVNPKAYKDVSYYIIYLWSSMNYFGLNNNAEAIVMFDKAKATFEDLKKGRFYNEDLLYSLNSGYANFYYQTGNYKLAIDYSDKAMTYLKKKQRYPEYLKEKIFLSDIYTRSGDFKMSNELRKKALLLSDSINNVNLAKDINSLWTIFEVDKAKMEKDRSESEKAKLYIIVVAISIVVVLCAGFILILIGQNKILKLKNRKLYEQQTTEKILLEEKALTKQSSKVELSLYDRLVHYITTSEQYLNADISRESIAKELGTNRQYITEAIQKNAGMSFPEFINNFRLEYASNLLRNKKQVRIKEVYLDSGFNNRTTFTRLFRDKYGMTPSEFKECAENDK